MRDDFSDRFEFVQWALVIVVLVIGLTTDSAVQRTAEARYRIGWLLRDFYVRATEWIEFRVRRRRR
jgi:hypothetical protein